ncbi:MAG: ornithine cyclodeaminase family protein [Pseudomonadota bacterium]|nr:ornithine cyclodeaminase family protein [Pseudomonadota bacterium]
MQHLDAAALRERLPFAALVAALREAFRSDAISVPLRHSHAIGDAGTALLMPAWRAGGCFAVKTVTIFPGNGARGLPGLHGVVTLFDATTGVPLAVLDGSELTARRTAAAAALAADYLARTDATRLLVLGAGRVGALLPDAMCSVRLKLRHFEIWNRNPAAAESLAARWREQGLQARAVVDLQAAVQTADIVSCATLSTAPLVKGEWLAPGAHLDLIGSFSPTMREADGQCFKRCRVWVDTDEAPTKSGDLLQAVAEGCFELGEVEGTLSDLCRGLKSGRSTGDDQARERTLFKAVGTALEDLAAAELAVAPSRSNNR